MADPDSPSPNSNLLTFNLNVCPDYILACISTDEHMRERARALYNNVKPKQRGRSRVYVFACAFVAVLLHVIM
jgi:hypothetical protein